jgi:hypothetical protein
MKENNADKAIVEEVPFCLCTNTESEAGKTCGLPFCPNAPAAGFGADVPRHPRLTEDGEATESAVIEEGRPERRALELLHAHTVFAQAYVFAWMGIEHLGGGLFCASVYSGTAANSPYLRITESEENPDKFLACVYVGGADGEEAEDPFLVAEGGHDDLADESLRMLASAGKAVQQ